jgi:hypothetical protein
VIAMMSANHIAPDLGAEIYVLDGPPGPSTPRDETADPPAVE